MKKTHLMAIVAAAVVLSSHPVWAQQPGQPANYQPQSVAVIDMQHIFKNYVLHRAQRDAMQADFQRANEEIQKERASIQALGESLKEYRVGCPDYKALEEKIAKREADFAVRVRMLKREFAEREAKMIYNTYTAIGQGVQRYCQANHITTVLQFDSKPINPDQPNDIVRMLNRQVVWHGGWDITKPILTELNRTAGDGQPPKSVTDQRGGMGVRRPKYE